MAVAVVVVPCSANEWMLSVGASESSRPSRPSESRSVSLSLSVSDAAGRSVRALAGGVENDLVRRSVLVLERVRPSAIAGGRSNHERLALPDDDDCGGGGALGCRGLTGAVVGGCGLLAAAVVLAAAAAAAASRLSVKLARSSDAAVAAAVEAAAAARSEVALALELAAGALASNEPDDGDADAAATRAGVEVMAPESDRSPDLRLARYCWWCCCCFLACCCCCCTTDDSNICCRCSSSNASGSRSARRWLSPLDCDRTRCKRAGFFLVLAALALEAEAAAAAAFSSWLMASEVERAAPNSTDRVVVSGRQSTRQSGTRMSRVRVI